MNATTVPSPLKPANVSAPVTMDEFARRHSGDRVELVEGQVQELAMPFPKHGKIGFNAARCIGNFVVDGDLGHLAINDSFVLTRRDPDTVRGADLCYWSYERLAKGSIPDGIIPIAPDLTVEVRSPSDRWGKIFEKVGEYLQAGVRAVVVLDADTATASVYRPDELQQVFDNGDDLIIPDILPGFSIPVRSLFE